MDIFIACFILLCALLFALCLSMSLFRVTRNVPELKASGENKVYYASYFAKMHKAQQLTAEYVPTLAVLLLFLHLRAASMSEWVDKLGKVSAIAAAAGRVLFVVGLAAAKSANHPHMLRFLGATITYVAFAGLIVAAAGAA